MAFSYFPSTTKITPVFWFPEYDSNEKFPKMIKLFNKDTLSEALKDSTGIFQGRNYGSFTGYIDNDLSKKIFSVLLDKNKGLESYINTDDQDVSPMFIYDLLGHGSGLPLNFLKYKQTGFYVSYSVLNDQTRFQLIRNAKVYGFASKLMVLSDLSDVRDFEKGCVVILPQEIQSLGLTDYDFISFNRDKIWIAVTFGKTSKAPYGFTLQEYPGFNILVNESVSESAALIQGTIDQYKKQKTSLAINISVPAYVPHFYEESVSLKEIPLNELPIIKYPSGSLEIQKFDVGSLLTAEWMSQFENFLFRILSQLRDEKTKFNPKDLLTREYIKKYWLRAFIHESINAENNLESLETIGDSALNFAVKQMLYNYNQKFKADELTNLYKKLTSKKVFGEYSKKIELAKFAVIPPDAELTITIAEDILEAFAGAMVLTGDEHQNGLGMILVKNFARLLMYDDLFGSERSLENLKENLLSDKITLINTNYQQFVGKGSFYGWQKGTGDSAIYTMTITDKGVQNLKALGFVDVSKLKKQYIATAEKTNIAQEMANEMLYKDLKQAGLTYDIYEKATQLKRWKASPDMYKKYLAAKQIAISQGYSEISVKIPESSKTLTQMILILIGQKDDNKHQNLQVLVHSMDKGSVSEVNRHLATIRLLENYISKNS